MSPNKNKTSKAASVVIWVLTLFHYLQAPFKPEGQNPVVLFNGMLSEKAKRVLCKPLHITPAVLLDLIHVDIIGGLLFTNLLIQPGTKGKLVISKQDFLNTFFLRSCMHTMLYLKSGSIIYI
jgi:hypothetical protein